MNKAYFILLIFSGILFSEIIPTNTEKLEILANVDSLQILDSTDLVFSSNDVKLKYPGRAMLLSAFVPGLGEIYAGSPWKAFLFAGIEASAWYYKFQTENEMELKEQEYKKFADEHWDFSRWVTHYYDFYNYRSEHLNTLEFYKLFSNVPNGVPTMFGNYQSNFEQIEEWIDYNQNNVQEEGEIVEWNFTHINDGSHSIAFYDPRIDEITEFSDDPPSNSSNGYFYCLEFNASNSKCNEFGLDAEFEAVLSEVYVQKNLHFYENIGKYNQFFMGWDDAVLAHEELILSDNTSNIGLDVSHFVVTADSMTGPINGITYDMTDKFDYNKETGEIELVESISSDFQNFQIMYTKASIFDNDGYIVPKSPNKWVYRDLRDQYNNLGKIAGYAFSTIMFNHVISMIDAVITTNLYNRKMSQSRISIEPVLDTNTKYGVGGIKLNYRF